MQKNLELYHRPTLKLEFPYQEMHLRNFFKIQKYIAKKRILCTYESWFFKERPDASFTQRLFDYFKDKIVNKCFKIYLPSYLYGIL